MFMYLPDRDRSVILKLRGQNSREETILTPTHSKRREMGVAYSGCGLTVSQI